MKFKKKWQKKLKNIYGIHMVHMSVVDLF